MKVAIISDLDLEGEKTDNIIKNRLPRRFFVEIN